MRLAIVCASGIGDALILESIAYAVRKKGWQATTFTNHLASFGNWLPQNASILPQPRPETLKNDLSSFDAVFLQHDNSQKAFLIKTLPLPVYTFYGHHNLSKHGPFDSQYDFQANRNQTMVENIAAASLYFFDIASRFNGLRPPSTLIPKRFPKRIVIHPTASSPEKMWLRSRFLGIYKTLQKQGYQPVFATSEKEQPLWKGPLLPSLQDLASLLFESGACIGNDSGVGHLASLLNVPLLTLADGLQMPLWKPGWGQATLLTPPAFLRKWRTTQKKWQYFITEKNVIMNLKNNVLSN